MKITPLHITLMLHYLTSTRRLPNQQAPAVLDYTEELCESGLVSFVERRKPDKHNYIVTPKGEVWIGMLLATPMPVELARFADPRTLGPKGESSH